MSDRFKATTPDSPDVSAHLAALDTYDILDTPAEQGFEDVTLLASRICDTPVALVSLVDRDRQWFKARTGFPRCETDLNSSVCKFVLTEPDILVIPDLTRDSRTAANPLVTGGPRIRFYAGAPLRTPEGVTIGSLCVIDSAPRPAGLSESQQETLRALARQVITLLELRRKSAAQTRAAEVQRESEARQSGALRIAQLGTYQWDIATDAVILDARAREIFGFSESEGTTAQEVFGRIHPEDLPGVQGAAMARAAAGEPLDTGYRIQIPGGDIRHVSSQGDFLRGADGTVERGVGVFADTTERVRADTAFRESETRYRTLFESIDVGFCIVEMKFDGANRAIDYRIVEANPAFELQTGAKLAGLWASEFAPNLERHWFDTYGRVALTGEPAHFENRAEVFGRWFDVRALRVGDPAAHRVAIFFSDISRRKDMEETLRRLNDTLEQQVQQRTQERDRLWRNTQDIQVIIDGIGVFQAVNPAFTTILGWTSDDVIGNPVFDFIVPDDEIVTNQALQHARVEQLPVVENRYRHKDGGFRWISWVATPQDELIYASGRHITAEKEQAEALRQAEEALRQAQKMEAVGQLTGGLAHDFNNLLAGISGSLELMQTRMQQGRYQDVERYMAASQGASKRAAALTHRLLAFSRRQTLDPKPTDVNRQVLGMQELIQRTVGPAIPVEVVGAAGLWPALIDPGQLENTLLNLCINARDAMPEGGRITIETANKWLDERASRKLDMPEGQYLSLCVTDTGRGCHPR